MFWSGCLLVTKHAVKTLLEHTNLYTRSAVSSILELRERDVFQSKIADMAGRLIHTFPFQIVYTIQLFFFVRLIYEYTTAHGQSQ